MQAESTELVIHPARSRVAGMLTQQWSEVLTEFAVGKTSGQETKHQQRRQLVAQKWDHIHKRKSVGRPRIRQVIVDLILRFARENPGWGYDCIQGALANVGYQISDSTVASVSGAVGGQGGTVSQCQ